MQAVSEDGAALITEKPRPAGGVAALGTFEIAHLGKTMTRSLTKNVRSSACDCTALASTVLSTSRPIATRSFADLA